MKKFLTIAIIVWAVAAMLSPLWAEEASVADEKKPVNGIIPGKSAESVMPAAIAMELAVQNQQMSYDAVSQSDRSTASTTTVPAFKVGMEYATGELSEGDVNIEVDGDTAIISDTNGSSSRGVGVWNYVDLASGDITDKTDPSNDVVYTTNTTGYAEKLSECINTVLKAEEVAKSNPKYSSRAGNLANLNNALLERGREEGLVFGSALTNRGSIKDTLYIFKKGNVYSVIRRASSGQFEEYIFENSLSGNVQPSIKVVIGGQKDGVNTYRHGEKGFNDAALTLINIIDNYIIEGKADEFFGRISVVEMVKRQLRSFRI